MVYIKKKSKKIKKNREFIFFAHYPTSAIIKNSDYEFSIFFLQKSKTVNNAGKGAKSMGVNGCIFTKLYNYMYWFYASGLYIMHSLLAIDL